MVLGNKSYKKYVKKPERLQEMQEEYNKWDRDLKEKKVIADLQRSN